MSKEMISIPAGNLLSIAATKSIPHLSALKEKTNVDRKTLRAINESKRVKTTTLQTIADKLRVPISHLLASNAADKNESVSGINDYQYREIKLQRLDGTALRKLASETDELTWFLNIDQMPGLLEYELKSLRRALNGWFVHINIGGVPDEQDNLSDQISYINTSTDIDKGIENLAKYKLKIFGGTYVAWERYRPFRSQGEQRVLLPILGYRSKLKAALSVVPEEKANCIVRVYIGQVPPQKFVESEIPDIERVFIDDTPVWSREITSDDVFGWVPNPF